MKTINPYILLVMKWLNDKDSVTQEELKENCADADAYADADAKKWIGKYFERTGEDRQEYVDVLNGEVKPKDKPVYTQAMCDAGELPSVGMECNFSIKGGLWQDVVVNYVGTNIIVLTSQYNDAQFSSRIDESRFKPLTPPTELIDGKAYQFDVRSTGRIVQAIYNKFDGKLHIGKGQYFDVSSADDIKPLTVEGES